MITVSNHARPGCARGLGGLLAVIAVLAAGAARADAEASNPDHYVTLSGIFTEPDRGRGAYRGYGASLGYAGRFAEDRYWELRFFTNILDTGTTGQIDYYQSGIGLDLMQPVGHPGNGDLYLLGGLAGVSNSVSPSSKSGFSAAIDAGLGWRSRTWTFWGLRPRLEVRLIHDTFESGQNDYTFGFTLEIPPRPERIVERTVEVERVETVKVPVEVEKIVEKTNVCVVPLQKGQQAAAPAAPAPTPSVAPTPAVAPAPAAPAPGGADTDGDGVPDASDKCADTLNGVKVGPDGCVDGEQTVVLPKVEFEPASPALKPAGRDALAPVAAFLKGQPGVQAEILGHTDSSGRPKSNQKLSEARASSVADYLVSQGVGKARVSAKGMGSKQPVADNATEDGRAKNRRVELHVKVAAPAP
jgi:outer membrane protein OmpA-like peptidoglycan-associated protein